MISVKKRFSAQYCNNKKAVKRIIVLLTCFFLTVNLNAQSLQPGAVTSGDQLILANTYPAPFIATLASGGSCNESYSYQWEVSENNVNFNSIAGAVSRDLSILSAATQTKYYRRKVICGSDIAYTPIIAVKVYTPIVDDNKNFVREITINKAGVNKWKEIDLIPMGDKRQSTTYLDGFGRAIQVVDKEAGGEVGGVYKDIVKHYEYDEAGRIIKDFLPYATSENAGKFKTNAATAQPAFVRSFFGEPADAPTYSLVEYDDSPLNRVIKTTAPGAGWAGTGVSNKEDFNKDIEKVHIWNLDYSATAIPVTSPTSVYTTGLLSKSISTDEKGNKVITYSDLGGSVILKKVQEKETAQLTNEHDGWVCTYYVYDDFGLLRYVITPKAVTYLDANGWDLNQTIVDELCYKYSYDEKGRPIIKKQPGVGEVKMVYDTRDRIVFTQDANLAAKSQWMTTLYDPLNRVAITGLMSSTLDRNSLQVAVTAQTATPSSGSPLQNDLILDDPNTVGLYQALQSITLMDGFSTGASFTAEITTGSAGSVDENIAMENVIINKNPLPQGSALIVLSITYYDNYLYPNAKSFNSGYTFHSANSNIDATVKTDRTIGMVTGQKVRVLDGDNNFTNDGFLLTSSFYDEKGRNIQNLADNIKGSLSIKAIQYDFSGKITSTYSDDRAYGHSYTITNWYEYDKVGRLTGLRKNFSNNSYKRIAEYIYDDLGQLKTKRLAPGYTSTGKTEIERLDYEYNIQGWLTGINKEYALNDNNYTQWDRYFGMYIGYENRDNQFDGPQFNGSITGLAWRSQGDNTPRKFDFTYDRLDRFISGLFKQRKKPSETAWSNAEVDFSTYLQYDDGNGNIKSMKHIGVIPGVNQGVIVDDLQYTYLPTSISGLASNKLKQVDDLGTLSTNNNGLMGDFKDANTTQDYYYDDNGNLLKDLNKNIKNGSANGITYNFLNKPEKIIIEGKSTIQFTYDASGAKLKKRVTFPDNSWKETSYINGYVFEEPSVPDPFGTGGYLKYILHEEGRLKIIMPHTKVNDNDYALNAGSAGILSWFGSRQGVYEYFVKDHLGNTRMVLTEEIQREYYKATMEQSKAAQEEPLFGKVNADGTVHANNELNQTRLANSPPNTTVWPNNNTDIVKLTASAAGKTMGPNLVLKVMAGDLISSTANYYYLSNSSSGSSTLLNDMVGSFVNALSGNKATALAKSQSSLVSSSLSGNTDLSTFLNQRNGSGTTPKAYLNIVFLDEQFKFIEADPVTTTVGSNFKRVNSSNNPNASLSMLLQKAPKNGWAFVFLSNESDEPVYFDNLAVTHEHSRIAEENHYYPYGLKIAGISSRAVNKLANKYGYQGDFAEHEEETGWDEFYLRMYDPQIGRWNGADPYDIYSSPYIGMGNNPISMVDPDGGNPDDYIKNGNHYFWDESVNGYGDFLTKYGGLNGFEHVGKTLSEDVLVQEALGEAFVDFGYSWAGGPMTVLLEGVTVTGGKSSGKSFEDKLRDHVNWSRDPYLGMTYGFLKKAWNTLETAATIGSFYTDPFARSLPGPIGDAQNKLLNDMESLQMQSMKYGGSIPATIAVNYVSSAYDSYANGDFFDATTTTGGIVFDAASLRIGGTTPKGGNINRIYSARELMRRGAEPGPFHNFPESFNQVIFESGTRTTTPNYFNVSKQGLTNTNISYKYPGTVNGYQGFFEIGVRPSLSGRTEVITHRFFKPIK